MQRERRKNAHEKSIQTTEKNASDKNLMIMKTKQKETETE